MKRMTVAAALLLLLASPVLAQPAASTRANLEKTIRGLVHSLAEVSNKADASATMELYSHRPEVSSIDNGSITRGWEAIRQQADAQIGSEGRYKISVGTIDVTPLGPSYALAVAAVAVSVEVGGRKENVELPGAMTIVFEKSGTTWNVLHDHDSIKFINE
jgi:ketosteroid isomerase-like protein